MLLKECGLARFHRHTNGRRPVAPVAVPSMSSSQLVMHLVGEAPIRRRSSARNDQILRLCNGEWKAEGFAVIHFPQVKLTHQQRFEKDAKEGKFSYRPVRSCCKKTRGRCGLMTKKQWILPHPLSLVGNGKATQRPLELRLRVSLNALQHWVSSMQCKHVGIYHSRNLLRHSQYCFMMRQQ